MRLHQLIYVSAATRPFSDADLEALVARARRENHARGITGLLLHSEGVFLQVLEGEKAIVDELYHGHIACDTRHTHLRLLADGPAAGRIFPDWNLGFVDPLPPDLPPLAGYLDLDGPEFLGKCAPKASPVLLALLRRFAGPRLQQARQAM